MKEYIFKTTATMKPYNNKKWYIDSNIVTEKRIKAETLEEALEKWKAIVAECHYIQISEFSCKNKQGMYVDGPNGEPIQAGYVITATTDFDDNGTGWKKQYIDLWVEILEVKRPEFHNKKPV